MFQNYMEKMQKSRMSFEESDMNPQLISVLKDHGITIMSEIQVSFTYIIHIVLIVKLFCCVYMHAIV